MRSANLRYASVLASLLALVGMALSFYQSKPKDDKYRISPTKTNAYGAEVYVPKDLEDAFKELDKMLTKELREEMRKGKAEKMIDFHFGLGLWLRNNWGLWRGLRLAKW